MGVRMSSFFKKIQIHAFVCIKIICFSRISHSQFYFFGLTQTKIEKKKRNKCDMYYKKMMKTKSENKADVQKNGQNKEQKKKRKKQIIFGYLFIIFKL